MSDRICLFAGTTEGRKLAEYLSGAADVTVCVATEYGEVLLDGIEGITVRAGRMDEGEMAAFFREKGFRRILDATHPYAAAATENIRAAAEETGTPLLRVLREKDGGVPDAVYVSSVPEAKEYLLGREGNILLTTGSKELALYEGLDTERVWARVLPLPSSLEACGNAGIPVSHIIAMQGPFTEEINLAQLRMIGAKYLVTKASGKAGGFEEKIRAAEKAGAVPVVIGRPPETEGLTLGEAIRELSKTYGPVKREITLVGIGPGSEAMLTPEAARAIERADAVLGASSVTALLRTRKPVYHAFTPEKVREALEADPSVRRAAVVLRGDTGFYSGAKRMLAEFEKEDVKVIPGVSSLQAFAAKLKTGWDDAAFMSLHGRDANYISAARRNPRLFLLTGGDNTPQSVCRGLVSYGLGSLRVSVGEKLSYPDERITEGTAEELAGREFDPLSVVLVENPDACGGIRFGIDDEEFIRGEVPMTKAEVRAVSLSKLGLGPDSVVWDVGAGTGSVSVECALAAYRGKVYAVEKDAGACGLIEENKRAFRTDNLEVVEGTAPGALEDLPAPTHAFIGGSGKSLRGILEVLLRKNPGVRIVMNTVTLETQAEAVALAKEFGFETFEGVTVSAARTRKAGPYHLMNAQNPVTVFVMQKGKGDA